MKNKIRKILSVTLCAALCAGTAAGLTGCSSGGSEETFTWWIPKGDGYGVYYADYGESMAVQWINNQYWDAENHALGTEGNGSKLTLTFTEPISGSEKDSLGTMISSGDYADLIDLIHATDSPQQMVDDGVLLELTDYVEQYMPAYVKFLDENPDVKQLTTVTDENGKVHYYALYGVADERNDNFMGYVYRRDWLVKYADVPSHVWDLANVLSDPNDPTSVDTSKITYTDYYDALANNDWTGWTENSVTEFTSSEGDDPGNDYTDNVIFPSGNSKPIYISDWEWMFRAFKKAIEAEGLANDTDAYCTTLYYEGALGTGDLYSSFGGGNPWWYYTTDENGKNSAQFGGDSENMKNYLNAMNGWYKNGWLDTKFDQRSSDVFYKINLTGFSLGKVGIQQVGMAYIGDTIRETQHSGATTKAYCMGCPLPINDKYGTEEQKFNIPDSMWSASKISASTGIGTAAEGKNFEALFTMFNWLYTEEGFRLAVYGLNEEQLASMEFSPEYYSENNIKSAYYQDENGLYYYAKETNNDINLQGALCGQRLTAYQSFNSKKGNSYSKVIRDTLDEWKAFDSTSDITKYTQFMTVEQSNLYNSKLSGVQTYMDQRLPEFIKKGVKDSDWDNYAVILGKYDYNSVIDVYNEVFTSLGIH